MRDQIKAAVLDYKVVFFRGQDIDRDQHAAFARQFGPLYAYPSMQQAPWTTCSAIHQITTAADPKKGREAAELRRPHDWDPYHSDTSWRLVPTWGRCSARSPSPTSAATPIWVDAGLAYDELPDDVKQRLDGLHVTHDFREPATPGYDYPIVAHPIVRTHRETGRKILFVNFTNRPWIVGLDRAESKELFRSCTTSTASPSYQVRFSWQPGSIAFWDNRAAVHYGVRNYGDFPRLLERILIADEPQYADL